MLNWYEGGISMNTLPYLTRVIPHSTLWGIVYVLNFFGFPLPPDERKILKDVVSFIGDVCA